MNTEQIKNAILAGETCMGMEFGSTRVKAVLLNAEHTVIAGGAVTWENKWEGGIWTYDLADAVANMQGCFAALRQDVMEKYGVALTKIGQIGISGMMHGLLALDENDTLVTPFRTWRNTMTKPEADFLSERFGHTIPQRWSIVHLYQLMKTEPENAARISRMTTLAGYIHLLLTGKLVLGCCEAAGMLPVESVDGAPDYVPYMVASFDELAADADMPWKLKDIFPQVLRAGASGGVLTAAGAALLDPSGTLCAGIPFCPPEGDGGTGMVCTGSLAPGMATVSAGTSTFGLFVLDRAPAHLDRKLELTITPDGNPVIEIQSNNGTAELDGWVGIVADAIKRLGADVDVQSIYGTLLGAAKDGAYACGGLLSYNCLSGEHLLDIGEGRPLFVRTPDSELNLPNFMRAQLFAIFAPLAYGLSLLDEEERAKIVSVKAHGGLFRTRGAAQPVLAAALNIPVTVSEEAGEGGPFGAALLASYAKYRGEGETLADYLSARVFAGAKVHTEAPDAALVKEYGDYMQNYVRGLTVERTAVSTL
ncbi:MAG: ATPase [Clostridia bacterium]|nr:ATPase [Clostridia bacterium]